MGVCEKEGKKERESCECEYAERKGRASVRRREKEQEHWVCVFVL